MSRLNANSSVGHCFSSVTFGTLSNVISLSGPVHVAPLAKDNMTTRSLLLSSAALLFPVTCLAAQPQPTAPVAPSATAPAPVQPTTAPTTESAPAATAPAAQPSDDVADEEEIVITGAKPRGSVIGDIPPQNTLDARDVRATGATNISELLDALAPQIGSTQGRGGERPVMLLNGQRISGFRELRDIPTEAIVRVEILPEEVALKYGYRADQKVVNIVLRQRFRSTTAQAGGGLATDGGYASGNGDLTRFIVERNGRTTYNLHYEGNNMLTEDERDILLAEPPAVGTTEQDASAALSDRARHKTVDCAGLRAGARGNSARQRGVGAACRPCSAGRSRSAA